MPIFVRSAEKSDLVLFVQNGRADAAYRHADEDHRGLAQTRSESDQIADDADDDAHDKRNERDPEVLRDKNESQSAEDGRDHVRRYGTEYGHDLRAEEVKGDQTYRDDDGRNDGADRDGDGSDDLLFFASRRCFR